MASKLVPTLKMFGAKYGKQLIEGVLVPCALSTHLGNDDKRVLVIIKIYIIPSGNLGTMFDS